MKKRTLLSMLLAGIMAVSLVGCGDDGKTNNNNNFTDKFQPTSTDTAVNGTESNTGDPVTPYEPGASGPTNSQVETPTPEIKISPGTYNGHIFKSLSNTKIDVFGLGDPIFISFLLVISLLEQHAVISVGP